MYSLIDANNFYCSCERLFQPKLEGKPVITLSNNDGCCIARSEEAKALGIDMGTPFFMLEKLIKKHNIVVFSSNYTLYGDISDRVMKTLAGFVPNIEIYSIDEAFLDMHDLLDTDLLKLGVDIRKTIGKNLGIPVTVGIGPTKVLAKMANRYAKKQHRDTGVFWAANDELVNEMLHATEVSDIWGIGHQYALLLRRNGFRTAYDVTKIPEEWIRKNMSVVGQRLLNELKGTPCIKWEFEQKARKNICVSRSFGQLLTDKTIIREALCNYAATVARKLRDQKSCAGSLQVFIQTNPHKSEHKQYMHTITVKMQTPSSLSTEIIKHACKGLDIIFKSGYRYMKCGIIAMELVPEKQIQASLFDQADKTRHKKLAQAMDGINKTMGRDVVRLAVQGFERSYRAKAEHLSRRYTTDMNQLLKVKI